MLFLEKKDRYHKMPDICRILSLIESLCENLICEFIRSYETKKSGLKLYQNLTSNMEVGRVELPSE